MLPLSSANYRFVLYKVIALPTQILNDTFVQYSLDHPYIRIDCIQRNYILLTETELKLCTESGITMCPANRAIFSTWVITCESSLFFQTPDSQSLCQKRLFLHYKTPTLLRHNSVWIFHSPTHQQVSLRCLENNTWTADTATLFGTGIIYNASMCSLTTGDFQTLPVLLGRSSAAFEATHPYVPDKINLMAPHELQAIEKTMPSEVEQLDEIQSQVTAPHRMNDIGPHLHFSRTSDQRERQWCWYLTIPTALCILVTLGFVLYSLWSYLHRTCFVSKLQNDTPEQNATEQNPVLNTSSDSVVPNTDDLEKHVRFTMYPLRPID